MEIVMLRQDYSFWGAKILWLILIEIDKIRLKCKVEAKKKAQPIISVLLNRN